MGISYIKSIKPSKAEGKVKEVYSQLKSEMGDVVEPIALHAINPDLLEGIWRILREIVVVEDVVDRKVKEAVGASVSESNHCPYCVDAHTIMIIGLQDKLVAEAIVKKDLNMIEDDDLRKIVEWSFNTKKFDSIDVDNPPFSKDKAPEIIGTAVFFHYLNRMVTVFLGDTILPINIGFLKGMMKSMAGKMFAGVLNAKKEAGKIDDGFASVDDLYWAKTNSRVENAFLQFYHSLDTLSREYIPGEVRDFMEDQVAKWDGSDITNIKDSEETIMAISSGNRSLAKILYLTAFAPHRIQSSHFEALEVGSVENDERILVSLSWASLITALKIGSNLGVKFKS